MTPKKVLMVCLGNTCRSPIAEAVFIEIVKQKDVQDKWEVDSAAIASWNIGLPPDHRGRKILRDHNIFYNSKARQIEINDFNRFDYIFGMDYYNMDDLRRLAPSNSKAEIWLLGDYDPKGEKTIRDPYFDDGTEGFEKCYEQCVRCCTEFIEKKKVNE